MNRLQVLATESALFGPAEYRDGRFISLIVQLLHSHTFEQDPENRLNPKSMNLEVFHENYSRNATLRQNLSTTLRSFLIKCSPRSKTAIQMHDCLEILRKFIEQLYKEKCARQYPFVDFIKIGKWLEDSNEQKKLENLSAFDMLGGPFVMVDLLLALQRHANITLFPNPEGHFFRAFTFSVFYRHLELHDAPCAEFLCSTPSLLSMFQDHCSNFYLHDHIHQEREIMGCPMLHSVKLLKHILMASPHNCGKLEKFQFVKTLVRTLMKVKQDLRSMMDLLETLQMCLMVSDVNKQHFTLVEGWAKHMLALTKACAIVKPSEDNDFFIMLVMLLNSHVYERMSPSQKQTFGQSLNLNICKTFVRTLRSRIEENRQNAISFLCFVITEFPCDRGLFQRLKDAGVFPALNMLVRDPNIEIRSDAMKALFLLLPQ